MIFHVLLMYVLMLCIYHLTFITNVLLSDNNDTLLHMKHYLMQRPGISFSHQRMNNAMERCDRHFIRCSVHQTLCCL